MGEPESRAIRLVPVVALSPEDKMAVRQIRNEPGIRKWMYSDHEIGIAEHEDWIRKLASDDRQQVFAIIEQGDVLGVVSANNIDRRHKKCDWAYYLTESARGGLGSAIEYFFIEHVFDKLGMV